MAWIEHFEKQLYYGPERKNGPPFLPMATANSAWTYC